jgi:hypothetical protein
MSSRGAVGLGGGGLIILALLALLTGTNPLELVQQAGPTMDMVDPCGMGTVLRRRRGYGL